MIIYTCKHSGVIDAIESSGFILFRQDDTWICDNEVAVQSIIDNFDHLAYLRPLAIARIKEQSEEAAEAITANYSQHEIDTWPYQRKDADAYVIDSAAPTPDIDMLAAFKGVDRLDQIDRTVSKVEQHRQFIYQVIAKVQNHTEDINISTDQNYLMTVNYGD